MDLLATCGGGTASAGSAAASRRAASLLGGMLAACLTAAAAPAPAAPLDLRDAERVAIERNLNLQAQTYTTRAAEALVRRGYGIYDPVLAADLATGVVRENITFDDSGLSSAQIFRSEYRRFNFSLSQVIPTGANIALEFDNFREDVDRFRELNPSYDNAWRLSIVQPLLQGFGREVTEQEILFAVRDREIAIEDLRERAFEVLTAVRDAWFDVLRYRDDVEYRRTSVALAERVLAENRARVEAGVLAPVEILEAQVGVQLRERELLDAVQAYEDALDQLTLLLNAPAQVEVSPAVLGQPAVEVSEEGGILTAFGRRPDLLRRLQEIDRLELNRRIAGNQLLPRVDLTGSYGHSGLGEDYNDTLDDLADLDFRSWEVGLLLSYPLGNRAARHELQRIRLLLNSQKAQLGQLRDQIRREVRAAIRDLDVNRKKIEVTELGTRLARERLDTLLKRKDVGLATTRDVLEGEEDLAEARTLHIAALADYNQAITAYLRTTGILLEHEGIHIARDLSAAGEGPLVRWE
jgi:outer membrane protein TolC